MISPADELFFFGCILLLIVIFCAVYAIFHHKKLLFKITATLSTVLLGSLYALYCYIEPIKIADYCIDGQCIYIVHQYDGGGVNAVSYLRIYDKKIYSRFQLETNNHIAFLTPWDEMEDCVCLSDKLVDNKVVIKGFKPVKINGKLDNIKLELSNYKLDKSDVSVKDLFYKYHRLKFRSLY